MTAAPFALMAGGRKRRRLHSVLYCCSLDKIFLLFRLRPVLGRQWQHCRAMWIVQKKKKKPFFSLKMYFEYNVGGDEALCLRIWYRIMKARRYLLDLKKSRKFWRAGAAVPGDVPRWTRITKENFLSSQNNCWVLLKNIRSTFAS